MSLLGLGSIYYININQPIATTTGPRPSHGGYVSPSCLTPHTAMLLLITHKPITVTVHTLALSKEEGEGGCSRPPPGKNITTNQQHIHPYSYSNKNKKIWTAHPA